MTDKWNIVIDMREGGDWSLDLLFAGLNKNGLNVLDVPYRDKHREWHDVLDGKHFSTWGLERRTLGFSTEDDRKSIVPNSTELVTLEILKNRNQIERIWLDERMESFQKYRELGLDKIKAKVIVVAGHDRFWNHSPQFVRSLYGSNFEAMLLDNWYEEYKNLPFKVARIGWSTNFDHYWYRPEVAPVKDIDISFIGYNSHPDRARFIDHIEKNWAHLNNHIMLERTPDTMGQFVSKASYFNIMQRSKICLNLRGAADRGKTMRAYEIPYVGSFMLSQQIDDPGMAEDFVNGIHCEYFKDESDLDFLINHNLKLELDREFVALRGHLHATNDLSVKQRWANVLKWLNDE
jgi:hypothetical protein